MGKILADAAAFGKGARPLPNGPRRGIIVAAWDRQTMESAAATCGGGFTAIDFETTGSVPGWPNEPWQIGIYRFSPAADSPPTLFTSLLRVAPDRPFNAYAPGRHAARRDELAAAPSLPELWEEISPLLVGQILVAHNIGTERSILRAAAPLHRLGPWVDTLALARSTLPGRASYALETLAPDLGLARRIEAVAPRGLAPHDALYDAVACGELLRWLLESFQEPNGGVEKLLRRRGAACHPDPAAALQQRRE